MTRMHIAAAITLALAWLAGAAGDEFSRDNSEPVTHIIVIEQMKFVPEQITVSPGDSVKWINRDEIIHDIAEKENNLWRSEQLEKGESHAIRVDTDTDYYCTLHPVMQGRIYITRNHNK